MMIVKDSFKLTSKTIFLQNISIYEIELTTLKVLFFFYFQEKTLIQYVLKLQRKLKKKPVVTLMLNIKLSAARSTILGTSNEIHFRYILST